MVEGSPGGSPFAGLDLPGTLPGNEREAAVNVQLERTEGARRWAFSRPAGRLLRRVFLRRKSLPENRAVVRLGSETTCRTFARFNRTRAAFRTQHGGGVSANFNVSGCRSGLPVGPFLLGLLSCHRIGDNSTSDGSCALCPVGVSPSGSATGFFRGLRRSETTGATLPISHTGGICRPAGFWLARLRASGAFGSPWWASSGRPPRLPIPRGSRVAIRVLVGFSSVFNRPSWGRSAGRLNALPVLVSFSGCRRHPGFSGNLHALQ